MERFHRTRTLRLLRAFVEEIGEEQYLELERVFECVRASGYSLKDIQEEDLQLIRRPEPEKTEEEKKV